MKRLLLVDAYAMIYRAYYAFIRVPRITSKGENTSAIFGFVITLEDLLKRLSPSHIGVAFDPHGKTFRHEAFEQYKAQREETPEDIKKAVPVIKEILQAMNIAILEIPGYEADDVIGTLAGQAEREGYEVYMATPDKDYGQLVSEHVYMYRPRHSGGFEQMGPTEVCEKYGISHQQQVIDLLGLMGDASDNIPGCVGVGEKTAVKLLQEYGSIDNLLAHTEGLKGALKTKIETQREQILFSRFLATIRTDVPIQLDENALVQKDADIAALTNLYTRLEFRSLLKKYQTANINAHSAITEPDLFSVSPTTSTSLPTNTEPDLFSTLEEPAMITPRIIITDQLPLSATCLAISIKDEYVYLCAQEDVVCRTVLNKDIETLLGNPSIGKISADMKSDMKQLQRMGVSLRGDLFDTSIAHYLIQPETLHDTPHLSEIYLHRVCDERPESRLAATFLLRPVLKKELEKAGAVKLFRDMEMPLVPVLADMECAGVRFDRAVLGEASRTMTEEMKRIEVEIQDLAQQPFNLNSPKQVGEVLFDQLHLDPKAKKTKSGQYITSEEVLLSLIDTHPIVGKILDYRALKKLLSTYIDALPELINLQTGKIHTSYNQTVTATGRLSSSNPNLQNLPIRSERGRDIRRAVIPDEGCVFLSADYSQIELRLMAHFSQDAHLISAFRSGQDIHAATAAKIFGVPLQEVTPDMRRKAKTANFGIIYGISAFGLAQQLGSSRAEAKSLIDGYFAAFPGVVAFIEQAKERARQQGFVETLFGRKRYLPDINSRNAVVRSFAERNAVNAPIQGTAADIIKLAMVRIHKQLKEEKLQAVMIMQVHDELNFNVPRNELERVRHMVVEEMQNVVNLSVPLIADCGVGANWLEAH